MSDRSSKPPHHQIVVGVRGDDPASRDAVALGARLARLEGADLLLGSVWASVLGPMDPLEDTVVRTEIERELVALRSAVPPDVFVRTEMRTSTSVLRGLQTLAAEHEADLLVLGAHRRVGGAGVDLAILHDAPCAIAVAPAGYEDTEPADDVVLAWDGSDEARIALARAVELAEHTHGTLRIVGVLEFAETVSGRLWPRSISMQAWLAPLRRGLRDSLRDAEKLVDGRVAVRTEPVEGAAAGALAEAAAGAAFIVAGSRAYGPVRRLVLGSTAAELLQRSLVPVLVTPRGAGDRSAVVAPAVLSRA